ncbi:MAG TPA: nucleotidyltransferase domain-containing protein [Thermoanaerobaculia bacterium]|nr:nucleotidyltransferase domain-containing protein [Thermoanaerobaculia bacterium]
MGIEEVLGRYRDEIYRIAQQNGVTRVRVFGDVVHGTATRDSQIDLLIDAGDKVPPWFPGELKRDLEELLGRRVHLAEEDGLFSPSRRQRVLAEAIDL